MIYHPASHADFFNYFPSICASCRCCNLLLVVWHWLRVQVGTWRVLLYLRSRETHSHGAESCVSASAPRYLHCHPSIIWTLWEIYSLIDCASLIVEASALAFARFESNNNLHNKSACALSHDFRVNIYTQNNMRLVWALSIILCKSITLFFAFNKRA